MSNNNSLIFEDFKKAIQRLQEVLSLKKNAIIRDSAIKRFELCFDLAWKLIKLYAKDKGIECYSPRDCFKTAFQLELIRHDEKWLEMIEGRNLAVHLYGEENADKLYSHLKDYLELFQKLLLQLEKSKN